MNPSKGTLKRIEAGPPALDHFDALSHLREDPEFVDANLLAQVIRSVQDELEPPNGWLGRALTESRFTLFLPRFADRMLLTAPPIISVDEVRYIHDGVPGVVDTETYRVTDEEVPSVVLATGKSWPDADQCHDAVQIDFTAGYEEVPEAILQYMKIMVSHRWEIRQGAIVGTIVQPTPFVRDMLEGYRVRL